MVFCSLLMLLSIDNNKSMTTAEKAAARLAMMTSYASGRAQPTFQSAKGTGKASDSEDSSTTELETEDSKNRCQAKASATEALGPISDPDEWLGPISSEMIAFILETVEGTHGPWAKKFFDDAKRVIPGETSATKEFLEMLPAATEGEAIVELEGKRKSDAIIRRQCSAFALDCCLVKLISQDTAMKEKKHKDRDKKRSEYRELVSAPMTDPSQAAVRAFDSSLHSSARTKKAEEKRIREAQDSDAESNADPPPSKKPTGKKSSRGQKGPGDEKARQLGQSAQSAINAGKKSELPKVRLPCFRLYISL